MSKEVATKEYKPLFDWTDDPDAPEGRRLETSSQDGDVFKPITGADDRGVGIDILCQAAMLPRIFLHKLDTATRLNNVADLMQELGPQDAIEGMLIGQLIQVSETAAKCMKRATHPDQLPEHRDQNITQAVKLMRVFREGLEALDKHRGKGNQKIRVEHVTVNEGGQAIVGNVQHGGRVKDEKQG